MIMRNTIIVLIGSGIGGALRHSCNGFVTSLTGTSFPWGILAINVVGSTLMGMVVGWWALHASASQELRLFLTTGIIGGFTTFSTFSLDTVLLVERGSSWLAMGYVAASVVLSLFGLLAGMWLMQLGISSLR